jgi:ribosomal protein L18E
MKKSKKLEEYPFHIRFDSIQVKAVSMDKNDLQYIAKASADKLKNLLPKDFDFESSYDILGVAFNAYTPNLGNKNGHMISGEKGIAIAKSFKGKYINIEHERQNVVGCITDYSFSSFPDDQPIAEATARELATEGKVFNVVLSGIIWRAVNPDFADAVSESGDATSDKFGSISASWEVAFKEFNIAKGSKYLKECEIIDEDQAVGELKGRLKTFGGNGADEEGNPVYLNLKGNTILSLGIGLTETPAAEVKGIITTDNANDESVDLKLVKVGSETEEKKCDKIQSENVIVEEASINLIMKITDIKDINDNSIKELSASAVTDFIAEKIAENSEVWKKQVDEKESLATNLNEQIAQLQAQLDELKKSKEDSETALNELKNQIAAKEAEEVFQARMATIDSEYDLTDEDREIIAEDLKAVASEEDFEKWFKKFSTLASAKNKAAKKAMAEKMKEEKMKEEETKMAKASEEAAAEESVVVTEEVKEEAKVEDVVTDAVSEASVKNDVANAAGAVESLKDRMASAFGGDNIKIKLNR